MLWQAREVTYRYCCHGKQGKMFRREETHFCREADLMNSTAIRKTAEMTEWQQPWFAAGPIQFCKCSGLCCESLALQWPYFSHLQKPSLIRIPITLFHKTLICNNSIAYSQWYSMKRRAVLSVKTSNYEYPVRDTDVSAQRASVLCTHDNQALGF